MKDMEQRGKIVAMLKEVRGDIELEMHTLDGQAFNGRTMAASIGHLAAEVSAIAAGLINLLELEAKEHAEKGDEG